MGVRLNRQTFQCELPGCERTFQAQFIVGIAVCPECREVELRRKRTEQMRARRERLRRQRQQSAHV